jgi:hypothetical protein
LAPLRAITERLLEPQQDVQDLVQKRQLLSSIHQAGEDSEATEDPILESTAQLAKRARSLYKSWTAGAQIPLDAELDRLSDQQLGRCLAHHRFTFKLPADWFPSEWKVKTGGHIMARKCYGSKGKYYLDCDVVEPSKYQGRAVQLAISEIPLSKKQIEKGMRNDYVWWIRKLLDTSYGHPVTLQDIGLTTTAVEQMRQAVLNIWSGAPATASAPALDAGTGETHPVGEDDPSDVGPFSDPKRNEIWRVYSGSSRHRWWKAMNASLTWTCWSPTQGTGQRP